MLVLKVVYVCVRILRVADIPSESLDIIVFFFLPLCTS